MPPLNDRRRVHRRLERLWKRLLRCHPSDRYLLTRLHLMVCRLEADLPDQDRLPALRQRFDDARAMGLNLAVPLWVFPTIEEFWQAIEESGQVRP